jgi:hypothetical protein
LGVVAAALVAAAPAQAINDPVVPGDECSNFHSVAVGDPFGNNPGINGPSPVNPPASNFNQVGEPPGAATGAKGSNPPGVANPEPDARCLARLAG